MSGAASRPGPCARCAQAMGAVCCQVPAGERLATLTLCDLERIQGATGLEPFRFVEREELDATTVQAYEQARPLYRGLFASGVRLGLKAVEGACPFLEAGRGCQLPPEAKPLACRLYPFDLDTAGALTLVDAPQCLAVAESGSETELLAAFATTREALEALGRQVQSEVDQHVRQWRRRQRGQTLPLDT